MGTKRIGHARIRSLINENLNQLHPVLKINAGAAGSQGATKIIIGKNGDSTGTTANPYTESATKLYEFGTMLFDGDRVYRYVGMGAGAVTAGKTLQHRAVHHANHRDLAVASNVAAGATSITVTFGGDTDAAEDLYAGGYIAINDGTGEGQMFKIKGHAAVDAGVSTACTLNLFDAVSTALASADSKADLITNVYDDLIIAPAAETGAVVGVTVIDMTAAYYGWVQIGGPCAVLQVGTVVLGNNVVRSGGTAGGVAPATDDLLTDLGECMVVNGTGDYCVIWLRLE